MARVTVESSRLLCRLGIEVFGEVVQINHWLSPCRAMQTLNNELDPAGLDFSQQVAVSVDVREILLTHRGQAWARRGELASKLF